MTKNQVWNEFNAMQQWAMTKDSVITHVEFFAEPVSEQHRYYDWMCHQVPDHLIGRYWSETADTSVRNNQ